MKLALEQLADNPIIDELAYLPLQSRRIISLRACSVMFRKPFIEVTLADGEVIQRHFQRPSFAESWAEACVILETLTGIQLISDFRFTPVADRDELVARVLACRDECIAEAGQMYEEGMYAQFLLQFGEDCANLPAGVVQRIEKAKKQLAGQSGADQSGAD
jgi:hypothetical protein